MLTASATLVLIVDDNHDNVHIIQQYLEAIHGYHTVVAYDGEEALEQFEHDHPAIVLLDVMMPGLSGWDVCRIMKCHPSLGHHVRVIMVTALDDLVNKRQALQNGADDFLQKPLDLARLATTIHRNVSALAQTTAA